MTRDEALDILGLGPEANLTDIEHRYMTLMRRAQAERQAGADLEDETRIGDAYSTLTGKTVEPVVIPEKQKKVVLGRSLYEWLNLWYYTRWRILITIVILAVVGTSVYTIATRPKPDIEMSVIGNVIVLDEDFNGSSFPLRAFARSELNTQVADLRFFPVESEDNSKETIGIRSQVALVLTGGDPEDLIFTNEFTFPYYAASGLYRPIEDVYEQLRTIAEPDVFDRIVPRYGVVVDENNNPIAEPYMMGLDITGTWIPEGLGFYSTNTVLCLGTFGTHPEKAEELIYAMFREQETLEEEGRVMYDALFASMQEET